MRRKFGISAALLMLPAAPLFAEENPDVSKTLFHHILNSNKLALFPFLKEVTLPFGINVHEFMLMLTVALISALFLFFVRRGNLKPRGGAVFMENLVLFVRNDIVVPIMGEQLGDRWLPFFTTQFLFILTVNLFGLIPAFKTATGNINVTTSLALMVFIIIFIVGFKELGFTNFFKNLIPKGVALPIGLYVAFLEFSGIFTKSIVLSLRLFANMFAGHLAILSFLVLIFVISPLFTFVAIPFAVFTYVLEVLIAVIQSFVFTLLSCIFIMMAMTPEGE